MALFSSGYNPEKQPLMSYASVCYRMVEQKYSLIISMT